MPFSSSKYLYSWEGLSNLVDLLFEYLAFSNKRKTTFSYSFLIAYALSTRLKLIWPKTSLKTTTMSKNAFLAKSFGSQWVKQRNQHAFCYTLEFVSVELFKVKKYSKTSKGFEFLKLTAKSKVLENLKRSWKKSWKVMEVEELKRVRTL